MRAPGIWRTPGFMSFEIENLFQVDFFTAKRSNQFFGVRWNITLFKAMDMPWVELQNSVTFDILKLKVKNGAVTAPMCKRCYIISGEKTSLCWIWRRLSPINKAAHWFSISTAILVKSGGISNFQIPNTLTILKIFVSAHEQ